MLTMDQLKLAMRLRNVTRFATHRLQKRQSVSDHSFRMACIYIYLGGKEIVPALTHDISESYLSDIPSPAKKKLGGVEQLEDSLRPPFENDYEKKLSQLADLLELVLDLKEQLIEIGKLPPHIAEIYETELDHAKELAKELNKKDEVSKILKEALK